MSFYIRYQAVMTLQRSTLYLLRERFKKRLQILCLAGLFLLTPSLWAGLTIEISEGYDNAIPIAIVPFGFVSQALEGENTGMNQTQSATKKVKEGVQPSINLAQIISANLRRSGQFKPVLNSSMPAQPSSMDEIVFKQWRALDVDNMLIGRLIEQDNGLYQIEMRFIDVLRKKQVLGKRWSQIPYENLRQIAHQISDVIYEEMTGIRGAFNTQIAYVTMRKKRGKRHYTLEVADSDGFNAQAILKSTQPIMSPSWSPDGQKLAYVSFENGRSEVFVQSLDGQYRYKVAGFKGINGAPAWSPDGSKLALTLSKDGSADIYIMELKNKQLKRLTRKWSIETEAVWAPNGQSLFFNSDRRGQPQVFQVFLDTLEIRRVSFEGRYNANPEISPNGRYLAMVHGSSGGFNIGLLDLYTDDFNILTDTFLDESPTFAPNGEMILYAMNRNGRGQLAVVAIDGNTSQILSVKNGEVREPAWGPFLTE